MTAVESAIAEIDKLLMTFNPKHEGLRDFARLNLREQTQEHVRHALIRYDRRLVVLEAAKAALKDLLSDGYPELKGALVDFQSLEDLKDNTSTIEAALTIFGTDDAKTLAISGGDVAPKA